MISRERVATALRGEMPDRVPYCELGVDRSLAQKLLGWAGAPLTQGYNIEAQVYTVDEVKEVAEFLHLDNIWYVMRAPVYANKVPGIDGRLFYGDGQIKSEADLSKVWLPDPHDPKLYEEAERFVANKGDFSAWFVTRAGIYPTMLSMGMETFSIALFEDRGFVEKLLDHYFDWTIAVAERVCKLDFDVFVSTDDVAFKTATFFSPKVFREMVLPRYQRLREVITLPWVIHSDGNNFPFMDDLVSLGIVGFHPNEKGAQDIVEMKRRYGERLCLLGNVDLNLLGLGTPEMVEDEVRGLIRDVGKGGGYIVTSGNSLAGYVQPENAVALSRAVLKYGNVSAPVLRL